MNDEQLDTLLKQQFNALKRQNRLSKKQLNHFKSTCKKPQSRSTWATMQWLCASIGAVFLAHLLYSEYDRTTQPLYTLNLDDYQQVEVHTLKNGQYSLSRVTAKQHLDENLKQDTHLLKQLYSGRGQLVEKQANKWFIVDCQQQTLLEVSAQLVAQLTKQKSFEENNVGTMIAFEKNQKGQLVSLAALGISNIQRCG
ncbi:hypothetical protein HG263_17535 [Pseudoalteromonas sp. JBTF-M23]|uniref:Uncharacterized protein n=1 Tax=Pseudoalteromonas caenipelagi TaxID=2726988 RepID=A0A849VFY1_9GAMM|nr:hypothetical protein [Pseudoalteromonas caenipelagi]NOU52332.1 hypothetical protein [Pseudoalteromonas caenipelagi]